MMVSCSQISLERKLKVKKFELSPKLEMIICELKVNFDCLFMFSKLLH